jgi:diphthine synthase
MVESESDAILSGADSVDIAFLVVGDPFGYCFLMSNQSIHMLIFFSSATTHTDLSLRARLLNIPTRTVHNASILTGVSITGLSLYNFGQTTSMVFFTDSWRPASFYDRLSENARLGLHSLILLDIKVKEPDLAALARTGKMIYDPPRFLSARQCAQQMVEVEEDRKEAVCGRERLAVAVARVGAEDQVVVCGTLEELMVADLGRPLHSMVLLGSRTYELEKEFLREYSVDKERFDRAWVAGGYGKA